MAANVFSHDRLSSKARFSCLAQRWVHSHLCITATHIIRICAFWCHQYAPNRLKQRTRVAIQGNAVLCIAVHSVKKILQFLFGALAVHSNKWAAVMQQALKCNIKKKNEKV